MIIWGGGEVILFFVSRQKQILINACIFYVLGTVLSFISIISLNPIIIPYVGTIIILCKDRDTDIK